MRALLEVSLIALASSWKWLLGVLAVAGALVGILFGVGVLGGGPDDAPTVVAPTPRATTTPTRTPQPTTAPATATLVTAQVIAAQADNVGSVEFVLVFDPDVLKLNEIKPGALAGDGLMDTISPGQGRVWAGIIALDGISGDGPLVELEFTLLDDSAGTTPITLADVSAFDANNLVDIITEVTPGEFTPGEATVKSPTLTFR